MQKVFTKEEVQQAIESGKRLLENVNNLMPEIQNQRLTRNLAEQIGRLTSMITRIEQNIGRDAENYIVRAALNQMQYIVNLTVLSTGNIATPDAEKNVLKTANALLELDVSAITGANAEIVSKAIQGVNFLDGRLPQIYQLNALAVQQSTIGEIQQ